jgi:hypothetical protein
MILQAARTQLGSDFFARPGPRIDDRNEFAVRRLRVLLGVEIPQITHTDDCRSDFCHGGAIMPARPKESLLPNPLARVRSFWSAQSPLRRNLLLLALALAFGLLVLPWLIWIAGSAALGPYAGGNVLHFIGDFFVALAHGELVFWLIVLGPPLFLILARLLWWAVFQARTG